MHPLRYSISVLLLAVTLVAGCSSGGGDDKATGSAAPPTTSSAPGAASTRESDFEGVRVPDAYTPMTLAWLGGPTYPFLGTDGKYHVAYDLSITNATPVPATLDKIDVVDGTAPSTVIASFSGPALVDPNCRFGDCNRLRALSAPPATSTVIAPQETRIMLVDFTVDSPDRAPKVVLHHVYGSGATSPAAREPSPVNYLATPYDIGAGSPRVIAPPVRGNNWVALNGCCYPGFAHRAALLPTNGKINNSQRFAIDWKRTNDRGEFYTGDKTKNESYVDYGADVYAVADGTVTSTLDTVAANAPGVLPAEDPVLQKQLTVENVDGNHVVIDIGGGVWAMYAHFIQGSILVKPGDKVKKGDKIAKLGNTGNANASHLHFQLMNGPSLVGADGLPYEIDGFGYRGQVLPEQVADADDYLTGTWFPANLPAPQQRKDELPLNFAIVDFPS